MNTHPEKQAETKKEPANAGHEALHVVYILSQLQLSIMDAEKKMAILVQ